MKLGAITATLENLEEVVAEQPVEAAETATETAELGGELQSEEGQIEGMDTGIEDAGVAAGQIDELTEVAEDSLAGEGEQVAEGEVGTEGEGLSEGEASLIEISHESIMSAIGMPVERRTYTPESFADKKSRREVTMEALEKLKESAGKVKEGVIKALKAAFEAVVGFVSKLLANRALMEKHLKNLEARISAAPEGAKKAETIQAGASMLSLNGQANAGTAVKVLQGADQVLVTAKKIAELMYVKRQSLDESNALSKDIANGVAALPANGEGKGILAGDKAFKVNITADSTDGGVAETAGFSCEVIDAGKSAENMAAPSKQEMSQVIKAAQNVLTNLREAEKIRSRLKDFVMAAEQTFHKVAGTVASKVGTEGTKAKGANYQAFWSAAANARKVMTKFMTTAFSNAFKAVKAAADFVTAGLKNIAGEAAAAKPEGEAAAA